MAVASGLTGYVVEGANTITNITNWKLSFKMGKEEYVPFGAAVGVAKKRIATVMDVSGSFEGPWDGAITGQSALQAIALAGTSVVLKLYVNATNYYTGSALIDMDVDNSAEGLPQVSFSFEQDGATAWSQPA
jgi:hypothetical protein